MVGKGRFYTTCRYTGRKIIKPGLKLIGAKTKTRDILYQYRPKDCTKYIEPFLGTGGILIGNDPPLDIEIGADVNEALINYYKVLQSRPEELFRSICGLVEKIESAEDGSFWKWIRGNEGLFAPNKDMMHIDKEGEITWAVWFYCITKYAMNGIYRKNKKGICNSSWCQTVKGRGIFTEEWFWAVHDRVKNVQFKCQDYGETIKEADENTWLILDSPYSHCKTTYNGVGWKPKDFMLYATRLMECRGKWLVTINDNEFIRSLFKDYRIIDNPTSYSASQTVNGRGVHKELIVLNYE